PDHDGEKTGRSRRVRENPCLPGSVFRGSDTATPGQRPDQPGVRRVRRQTRHAGALVRQGIAGGARRDPEAARQSPRFTMTPLLTVVGWTLIHFIWQAGAIAVPVAVLLRLAARRSANARYLIACAGLVAMMAAPIVTARVLWVGEALTSEADMTRPTITAIPQMARTTPSTAVGHSAPAPALALNRATGFALPTLDRVAPTVTLVWFAGVALLLLRMFGGWWRVRRLHRRALATGASQWQAACRRIAFRLGLPAAAHVVESSLVDVPTVVGLLRPAIILPISALATLSPIQVEAILAHELAHIRRHDYLVNVLQTFAETLLFYHPAVWWMSKRIRAER